MANETKTDKKDARLAEEAKAGEAIQNNSAPQLPDGYAEANTELAGMYAGRGVIEFRPVTVLLSENRMSKQHLPKMSTLLVGELLAPCKLLKSTDEKDRQGKKIMVEVQGNAGDRVGIWYSPGMSELKRLAGAAVWMVDNGVKDTGSASPMKCFRIAYKGAGKPLFVSEDRRKDSRSLDAPFPLSRTARAVAAANASPNVDEDDIPF